MKKLLSATVLLGVLISGATQAKPVENAQPAEQATKSAALNYSTGGYAVVEIQRPVSEVFKTLTNVNNWPEINKGVTQKIAPENVQVAKNTKFKETISSLTPGIKDWTNEWNVETYIPNKKFVISGLETFASVPIHSRITYEFSEKSKNVTTFKRSIDVTLDTKFMQGATKQEIEALYMFLGSQWAMADHLKKYVESK
ncbi:SRPBCC family protein [Acinetobacter sp. Marseille-Q1618]|uniref:SRPBCC family protein n=1 Tax=Acinetobacter sp. Marseille-Q1618 TaxID=2697502 RepID=UPI00156FDDF7|nr:SRPBCC family protein [Acinetobacter sp. Marseille-Q1618]